jgi:hypothetical protein
MLERFPQPPASDQFAQGVNFMRGRRSRCASNNSVCSRGDSTLFFARNSVLF